MSCFGETDSKVVQNNDFGSFCVSGFAETDFKFSPKFGCCQWRVSARLISSLGLDRDVSQFVFRRNPFRVLARI